MKEIINKAREWALEEIKKNMYPRLPGFNLSNEKGQEIAKKLNADKDIVLLGTLLMDIKLGECFKGGKLPEHVKKGTEATRLFLEQFKLNKETKEKIINCVAAHHKAVPFSCKEAEIVANADCYRFLNVKQFLQFIYEDDTFNGFEEALSFMEGKVDEKWNILSLKICKDELAPHYKLIKEIIAKAKEK